MPWFLWEMVSTWRFWPLCSKLAIFWHFGKDFYMPDMLHFGISLTYWHAWKILKTEDVARCHQISWIEGFGSCTRWWRTLDRNRLSQKAMLSDLLCPRWSRFGWDCKACIQALRHRFHQRFLTRKYRRQDSEMEIGSRSSQLGIWKITISRFGSLVPFIVDWSVNALAHLTFRPRVVVWSSYELILKLQSFKKSWTLWTLWMWKEYKGVTVSTVVSVESSETRLEAVLDCPKGQVKIWSCKKEVRFGSRWEEEKTCQRFGGLTFPAFGPWISLRCFDADYAQNSSWHSKMRWIWST